jgi:hypothetical protein
MDVTTLRACKDELEKIAAAGMSPAVTGAGIGALAAFGLQYLANKAPKDGKSMQRQAFEKIEQNVDYDKKRVKKEGKKSSFWQKSKQITAKPMSQLAALAEKHPIQAAIPAAVLGASAGARIGKALL